MERNEKRKNFMLEEISADEDDFSEHGDSDHDLDSAEDSVAEGMHELDIQIAKSNRGFSIPLSEETADQAKTT